MFILLIVASPFVWIPKNFNMITFPDKKSCEFALSEAKKQWSTIDALSKCIDVEKESEIRIKEAELKKLRDKK